MLGAAGAMCCFAACTGLGLMARSRTIERLAALTAWTDALEAMALLLSMERLSMDELMLESAKAISRSGTEGRVRALVQSTGEALAREPYLSLAEAYGQAKGQNPLSFEGPEEGSALELLFSELGKGTAEMRERAVKSCLRRLSLCLEKAREKTEKNGKLYAELGALGGLMLAIALW